MTKKEGNIHISGMNKHEFLGLDRVPSLASVMRVYSVIVWDWMATQEARNLDVSGVITKLKPSKNNVDVYE